jgi:predicted dehydrogenase
MGLRFGLIGCGAISEALYLPALSRKGSGCSELHLADTDACRLADIAQKYRATSTTTVLDDLLDRIDVAVVATPPATHFQIVNKLIAAHKHVFCEKPFTVEPTDAEELVRKAKAANIVLMTNNQRRSFPALARVAKIIQSRDMGRALKVTWIEGYRSEWPTQSGYCFKRQGAGLPTAGTLLDMGTHVVDTLCWWFGQPTVIQCLTDSYDGPDARARLVLDYDGTIAEIDLSAYQHMKNSYSIQFERGVIFGGQKMQTRFHLQRDVTKVVNCERYHWSDTLFNFIRVVNGTEQPTVTGADVLPSIWTIANAYRSAKPFEAPWLPRWS